MGIPLTRSQVALVDDEDYEALAEHKWSAMRSASGLTWYAVRHSPQVNGCRGMVLMHRVITGAVDGQHVDHKDGNGLLNARSNLRIATRAQNGANRGLARNNSSGYKGVSWHVRAARWQAVIQAGGRSVYLGNFRDPTEAALAYDHAAIKAFGEFARLNFPLETEKADYATNAVGLG